MLLTNTFCLRYRFRAYITRTAPYYPPCFAFSPVPSSFSHIAVTSKAFPVDPIERTIIALSIDMVGKLHLGAVLVAFLAASVHARHVTVALIDSRGQQVSDDKRSAKRSDNL